MLLFDSFPSLAQAHSFAEAATVILTEEYGVEDPDVRTYTHAVFAAEAGYFPFKLTAPVVMIERLVDDREAALQQLVGNFHGSFAGT